MSSSERLSRGSIAVWGTPGSGRTTFLGALNIALAQAGAAWVMRGADEDSAAALARITTMLLQGRAFPMGTGGVERFRWMLIGPAPQTRRRWFGRVQHGGRARLELELVDSSGSAWRAGTSEDLIGRLADCGAILFLYDPVLEYETGDAYGLLFSMLAELSVRAPGPDGRLPHYVAVCVTKFDDARILQTAEKLDLLTADPDPPGFPRVAADNAREFFVEICQASRSGNAGMIPALLERTFRKDRIRYFATSSIGLYLDPAREMFNPSDYQNLLPDVQGVAHVRGQISPINVLEPVLWLSRQVASDRAPAG